MLIGDPSKAEAAAAKYYEENAAGRVAVESDSVQFSVTDENKTVTGSGTPTCQRRSSRSPASTSLPL